jgi:predicted metal-dependent HD superfamily phosphohydrolase
VPEDALRARLLACYAEPHRAYHTALHVRECLEWLDAARGIAERPAEVEVALWFHDAIYDPRASDSEARSAAWAERAVREAGAAAAVAARIGALVLATRHDAAPGGADAALLVDVDLAILGAPAPRFDAYETQIRSEYDFVAEAPYRVARSTVLNGFLARARIYATDWFHARLEAAARANLARSLARLAA